MKPTNRFYAGGPLQDPPDDPPRAQCSNCKCYTDSSVWFARRGNCPKCGAWGTAIIEED